MQLVRWIKRLFGAAVGYDLDPLKQTAAAQVADKRMIAKPDKLTFKLGPSQLTAEDQKAVDEMKKSVDN